MQKLLTEVANRSLRNIKSLRRSKQTVKTLRGNMNNIFVYDIGDNHLQISFCYRILDGCPRKEFTFCRSITESVDATITRMCSKMEKELQGKVSKKMKKSKHTDAEGVALDVSNAEYSGAGKGFEIQLFDSSGNLITQDRTNRDAWKDNFVLNINNKQFTVIENPPLLKHITLPTNIMAEFPVFPRIKSSENVGPDAHFYWFVQKEEEDKCATSRVFSEMEGVFEGITEMFSNWSSRWKLVGKNNSYTPTNADIGCQIQLICIPQRGKKVGKPASTICPDKVGAGPGPCPFEDRHQLTKTTAEKNCFRCVSYNILADLYADSDFAREVLYPYCPPYALSGDYRKHLICKELLGYNGDIICLQEVDKKVFSNDLLPTFTLQGFGAKFNAKAGLTTEGVAILYRNSKFTLVCCESVTYSDMLQNDTELKDLLEMVRLSPALFDMVKERGNVLQLSILESVENPGHLLFVANTHLFWYPTARNVRLIQMAVAMAYVDSRLSFYQKQGPGKEIHVMFCGDLNSQPGDGVNVYMTTQQLGKEWPEWREDCIGKEGQDLSCAGCHLYQPIPFTSACGQPPYTNYVKGFHATLDWIYIHKLRVKQVIPLPCHSDVTRHTALPSVVFPSDHLALVCDLTWQPS